MTYELGTCRPDELGALVDLCNLVFRSRRPGNMGAEYPLVFDAGNLQQLRVARLGRQLVAHVGICIRDASILGARVRVASIGAVATHPDHRGHGLASALMEDARAHSVANGCSLMLISGGRGLYHRLGYVEVGSFLEARTASGVRADGVELRPYVSDDLNTIIALHQQEPVRFLRSRGDWEKVLAAGMLMNQHADLYTIRTGGVTCAYLAAQRPVADPEGSVPAVRVQEFAGSRAGIAAVLAELAARYGSPGARLFFRADDAPLSAECRVRGMEFIRTAFPGTLAVLDPVRFLGAMGPILEERASAPVSIQPLGEGLRVSLDGERMTLNTRGEASAFLFGGDTEEAGAIPEPPPGIFAALQGVLPIPLPWYGYNYV